MNKTIYSLLLLVLILSTQASADNLEQKVSEPVLKYFNALNNSDHNTIMKLYSNDAVFMQQGAPAFKGKKAIDAAYTKIFELLKLDVSFKIAEIKILSHSYALVRTHSSGTALFKPEKKKRNEGSNELFILKKINDQWKIDHYIFSADHR